MQEAGGGPRTVLVVDDEPDLCEIVRRMLDGHGYRVVTAGGVADARARSSASPAPIDLLITDLRMPDGSGTDLAEAVRAQHPRIAVLYMSGLPAHAAAVAELVGVRANVLAKPFTRAHLFAAVEATVAG